MKHIINKAKGLVRGVPTAVLLSAAIHFALLMAAGVLIVFTVKQRAPIKFTPPPKVERTKMPLIKPRVKLKKNVKPGSIQRIVSKTTHNMPDMQLPSLSGMGAGLGSGPGGFELTPDLSGMTMLGSGRSLSIGNDLEGTFYSLSQDRFGGWLSDSPSNYESILRNFFERGWNTRMLAQYYRSPQKLYATFIFIPPLPFEYFPRSFGVPDDVNTTLWIVHYKGRIMSQTGGKFRFWGRGLATLAIRVNNVNVGFFGQLEFRNNYTEWRSSDKKNNLKYYQGRVLAVVGDWFELEAGVPVDFEAVLGDCNGAGSQATLCVQQEGEYYPTNRDGGPVLPVFKTDRIPETMIDQLKYYTVDGDQDFDSDLTFNVH